MKQVRRFRFELFVVNWLLSLLLLPRLVAGQDLTVEDHRNRVRAILKDLRTWGITAEARFGCDIGPNPYAANERHRVVLELIGHYDELSDSRRANLWRRHIARFYELGLRDCGVLSPEEVGLAGQSQSLTIAESLYRSAGDEKGVTRVTSKMRGSAVASGSEMVPVYREADEEDVVR